MKKTRKYLMVLACMLLFAAMTLTASANPSGSEQLPERMIMTPTMQLNVRNAPGTHGAVVGTVNPGDKLVACENIDGWFMVDYNDQGMFVYGNYLSYLTNEDGTFNEQYAKNYNGVDINGNIYYTGSIITDVNENNTQPTENQPNQTLEVDELDIMMQATYDVNMREQPGGKIVDVLKKGEDIHVTGNLSDRSWYQCEVDGKTVYVSDDYLLPDFPQTMQTVCPVNVRISANTEQAPVGVLEKGDKIKVSGETEGWLKFTYEKTKQICYVYSMYLKAVK